MNNSIDWLLYDREKSARDSLYKVINWIKKNLYFLIWARSKPKKEVLDHYINFAKSLDKNIKIRIDDITPSLLYNRSEEEQQYYNELFKDFLQERWVEWEFISQSFSELSKMNLKDFIKIMDETDYADLNFILPEKKKNNSNLVLTEFVHYFTQNEILTFLSEHDATFLIWKFSAWLYYRYNNKIKRISFIILNKI